MQIIKFRDNLYQLDYLFLIGDIQKAKRFVYKIDPAVLDLFDNADGWALFLNDKYKYIIWMNEFKRNPRDMSILVHETLHAAFDVLTARDILFNSENHEPFTYYQQFLVRSFLEKLP